MFFDWTYLILVMPFVLLSLWASSNVNSTFKKYANQYSMRRITGAQAAIMLQNALDLTVSDQVLAEVAATDSDLSQWAQAALTVMRYNGIEMDAQACLSRADVAQILYQADILSLDAPGLKVINKQQ